MRRWFMRSCIILAMLVGAAGACPVTFDAQVAGEPCAWVELHPEHRWLDAHGNADYFRVEWADGSWETVHPDPWIFLYKPMNARVLAICDGERQLVYCDGWFQGASQFDIWLFALFTVGFLAPRRATIAIV